MIAAIVVLALFLHLLAVRSGEMTFYALGGLAILWLVLRKRQWKQAGALVVVLVLPFDQAKEYGAVPPVAFRVALPFARPAQVTLVFETTESTKG